MNQQAASREAAFRLLCLEIAFGRIGGERFNLLLLETGICLDEWEWEQANRLLGQSEQMLSFVAQESLPC